MSSVSSTGQRLAFIGLGVMGYPMAGHLARAGHSVTVFNRTASVAQRWVDEFGGESADSPAAAAAEAAVVLACVGDDSSVEQICVGPSGVLEGMQPGAVLVDHTTASADLARKLAGEARSRGCGFVDAPVSGGQAGAENGTLTIMAGGSQEHFAQVEPIISTYAKRVRRLGGPGAGQLTKMVNQICLAGLIQSLSEGLAFADKVGLDQQAVIDVISQGAAQSWQMDNRHQTMIADEYDHGFAVDWMRKDLKLALEAATRAGATLPIAALVDQFYAEVQAMGGSRWDTSSLLKRLS